MNNSVHCQNNGPLKFVRIQQTVQSWLMEENKDSGTMGQISDIPLLYVWHVPHVFSALRFVVFSSHHLQKTGVFLSGMEGCLI